MSAKPDLAGDCVGFELENRENFMLTWEKTMQIVSVERQSAGKTVKRARHHFVAGPSWWAVCQIGFGQIFIMHIRKMLEEETY